MNTRNSKLVQIAELAESNLFAFARLVNPAYVYGDIHEKVFYWLSNPETNERQLLLLPRGHLKSHCIATWVAWTITRDPTVTMIYLSAVETLAKNQMYAIKNMMTSDTYKKYWPLMFSNDEGDREIWSAFAFNVDHPLRREKGIRDNTLIVKTVKSDTTGLHCSHLVFDDVVIPRFAYSEIGRDELSRSLGQFESILNPGGTIKAVGTRYHPKDAYQQMIAAEYELYNKQGNPDLDDKGQQKVKKLWEIMEEKVEDIGDGSGNYLWPRTLCPKSGNWYGFNPQQLAKIRAGYKSRGEISQFYAQYYNNPNDSSQDRISREKFQYYDRKHLENSGSGWHFKEKKLNIYASMDIAWTQNKRSDYTAIAVVGIDPDGMIYVLDLERFKTAKFSVFYDNVMSLHSKWGFKKLRVETNAGGKFVKQELMSRIRSEGDSLLIEGKATSRYTGTKEERIMAILEPKYEMQSILHYKGGLVSVLEEEIVLTNPPHDDMKDALSGAVEICKPPSKGAYKKQYVNNVVPLSSRFGGRMARGYAR